MQGDRAGRTDNKVVWSKSELKIDIKWTERDEKRQQAQGGGGGYKQRRRREREGGREREREKMLLLDWVRGSATLTEHVQKSQVYKSLG